MAAPIQLIIFDCDGVLVDSEPISCRIVAEELQKLGLDISIEEAKNRFAGTSLDTIRQYFKDQVGKPVPDNFEEIYRERSHAAFEAELQAVPGIESALKALRLPRCVGSNGPGFKVEANLKITGLRKYFGDELFSAYDIQRWKPDPELYLHAAKTMNFSPENCLVVEDSLAGVQAAIAAGMRVVAYAGAGGSERLKKTGATVFTDMSTLPQLVTALQ